MYESPLIKDIIEESFRTGQVKTLVCVLETRFGAVTPAVSAGLQQVKEDEKLSRLIRHAAVCPSLQAFEGALHKELSAPAPTSTCGKRRSCKPPS